MCFKIFTFTIFFGTKQKKLQKKKKKTHHHWINLVQASQTPLKIWKPDSWATLGSARRDPSMERFSSIYGAGLNAFKMGFWLFAFQGG